MAQFSFRKTLFSKLALVLLRFRAVKSPQTENNLSTYAWEAGAATRSRANPPMYLYWDSFDNQYCTAMRGSFVHIRTFLVYKKLKTKIKTKKINIQIRFRLCNSNFILVFWHFVIVIIILIN